MLADVGVVFLAGSIIPFFKIYNAKDRENIHLSSDIYFSLNRANQKMEIPPSLRFLIPSPTPENGLLTCGVAQLHTVFRLAIVVWLISHPGLVVISRFISPPPFPSL